MKKFILFILFIVFSFANSYNNLMVKKIEFQNDNGDNFSFAVMGDNRDGNKIFKKIIQNINNDNSIKFAINIGDLVSDGYKTEFKKYISIIKTSNKPFISVIGNHEIPWYDGETNYEKVFGKTYFSFAFKNSYFIILDDSNKKRIGKKQKEWLINELKNSQVYQNRFVFFHVPLYDPRKGEYKKGHSLKSIKNAEKLNKLFDKYDVTMVFNSHIHSYIRGVWHKTPFIITGGAGAPLNKNSFFHYIKVEVNGENVNYKIVKINKGN